MTARTEVRLSPHEREMLLSWLDSDTLTEWETTRVRIVLLADEGIRIKDIAERVGVGRNFVPKCLRWYNSGGARGLQDRAAECLAASEADRDRLAACVSSADEDTSRRAKAVLLATEGWTTRDIAEHIGVTSRAARKWIGRFRALGVSGMEDGRIRRWR
jgi:transposase